MWVARTIFSQPVQTCQACATESKSYAWRYVQLVAPGMGKMPCEQVLLFACSMGTNDDSSSATCIQQRYRAWSLTNQNILNYEGYQKSGKLALHAKHEQ